MNDKNCGERPLFEKGQVEYLGIFFFLSGMLWVFFSCTEWAIMGSQAQFGLFEKFAAALVCTSLYIITFSILLFQPQRQTGGASGPWASNP